MALIPILEAAKLGLLPREFEDFFPGIARSSLFGSPLTLNLRQFRRGAGPLERGIGRFGFQHGVPGIAGVRFGLGPLLQGLGLSPGPSAVTAPGVVPGGRARAGAGGAPSAATLAGRTQPQDIATLRRLLETGQLDPRTLPPELLAVLLGGRAALPPPRPSTGPSGIAEPLAQTGQALRTASAAEQLVRAIQGGVPPDSFAMTPETRAAFEAQRRGERADLSGAGAAEAIPFALDSGMFSGASGGGVAPPGFTLEGATPFELDPGMVSGTSGGGAVGDVGEAGEVGVPLAGPGAGGGAATEGGRLPLPSAGQTLSGLLTALQLAQAGQQLSEGQTGPGAIQAVQGGLQAAKLLDLLPAAAVQALPVANIALGGLSIGLQGAKEPKHSFQIREAQERQGVLGGALAGLGSKEATMANMVFPGAGLVLGPIIGALRNLGVFGQHRTLAQKLRAEQLEAGRIGDTLRGPIGAYGQAQNLEDFFNVGGHVGYLTQPAEFIRRALTDPGSIMAASAPGGRPGEVSAMGVRAGLLGPSVQATVRSAIDNARRLAEQPDALAQLARAEYRAQQRAIQSQYTPSVPQAANVTLAPGFDEGPAEFEGRLAAEDRRRQEARTQEVAANQPQMEAALARLAQQFQADPYSVLPPDFQTLRPPSAPETIPPSPAAPPPAPGEASLAPDQSLPGLPPLPSFQRGGVVPRSGAYRLEAGEVVLPANGGRVIETRKDGNLYVPVDGGAPERAKKNPDPARFWRVVMSSQEAQDAIRSGDPAETPILANLGTMLMGPQKRAASLEFLRRAQHQNPAGTLMDALAVSEGIPPQAQRNIIEDYADRLTEMEEASRETGVFPVRPFLAPPPTLPTPPPRFPMPRAVPRGLVPAGI